MGWTSLLLTIWYGAGAAALAAVAYFAAAGEPTDLDFLLARLSWSVLIALMTSYLLRAVYQIDGSWPLKIGAAVLIGAFLTAFLFGGLWYLERREIQLTTKLFPLGQPLVGKSECKIPTDALAVSMGTNIAWSKRDQFVALRIDDKPVVSVARDKDGSLNIAVLKIFDHTGNMIAEKDPDNLIWVAPSSRRTRPDRGTLIVYDSQGNEAVKIVFLNKNAILLEGTFRGTQGTVAHAYPDRLQLGGVTLIGGCVGVERGAAFNLRKGSVGLG